jgi:hypothetical protein
MVEVAAAVRARTTAGEVPATPGLRWCSANQYRVQAPADLVGPRVRLAVAGGLEAETVLDRDEVEQAPFGLGDDIGPVARGEQLVRAGPGLAPGGGMPAGAVERGG